MGLLLDILKAPWMLFVYLPCCVVVPTNRHGNYKLEERQTKQWKKDQKKRIPPELPAVRRPLSDPSVANRIRSHLLGSSQKQRKDVIQTCTLLARLPPEIRIMIFEEVLGNSLIHIVSLSGRMGHLKCPLYSPAIHANKGGLGEGGGGGGGCDHQRRCFPRQPLRSHRIDDHEPDIFLTSGDPPPFRPPSSDFYGDFKLTRSPAVPLLSTCRQVYLECISVLYARNTFDFAHPETFLWFTRTLTPSHLGAITALQIGWYPNRDFRPFVSPGAHQLWFDMCAVIANRMPGLKQLAVWLYDWDLHDSRQQDRLLFPLSMIRGLQKFGLEVRELTGEGVGENKAVELSPFAVIVKDLLLKPRE